MITSKRITIKEVAKEAGVSTQTVSRVVNNEARVASTTRQRVQAVIDRTGYRPNSVARALIRGRTNTIGIISTGLGLFGPTQTITGIEAEAKRLGYSLTLTLLQDTSRNSIANAIEEMQAQNVAGIIWTVEGHKDIEHDLLYNSLHGVSVPLVATGTQPITDLTTLHIDNYFGGQLATQHLIEQGYRTIATITGPLSQWSADERLRAWQDTLAGAGLSADSSLSAEGDWSIRSGDRAIRHLLRTRPDIDAVFVGNDDMAIGVLSVAATLGRQVPADLGVIGYDDTPSAAYLTPSLSTIRQDIVTCGRNTMLLLDQQIRQKNNVTSEKRTVAQVKPQLVVRASSRRLA